MEVFTETPQSNEEDLSQFMLDDLQLAAELGKTLLERNKELETLLKEHKATIDEQEQEIVYLKKHTTALREVNDSRLKVYEQLEVGIQDLERANHRLSVENASDKKYIKTLTHNIETLESRCDELNKQLDETRQTLSMERRKNERLLEERAGQGTDATAQRLKPTDTQEQKSPSAERSAEAGYNANTTAPENCNFAFQTPPRYNANSTGLSDSGSGAELFDLSMTGNGADNEEVLKLLNELETKKRELITEKQRITELEEQLGAIIQENQTLQKRFAQNSAAEEMRSMHDELSILDEVRQGQMCSRCLGAMDDRATINDEASSLAPTEECDEDDDDERSHLGLDQQLQRDIDNCSENSQAAYRSNISSIKMKPNSLDLHGNDGTASPNPYRDLVDKYEALLELQRSSIGRKNGMSLAEEFQSSGDFNQTQKQIYQAVADANCGSSQNGDAASSCNGSQTNDAMSNANSERKDKNTRGTGRNARTPTEFSEAETSSSGYSDETSNKYTQTEERPGYFLCSIGDGEDCKFSIYDDASPIDSRFRNRPEYRELFKEIFSVLKKAAENKEEGEKLPLLDDANPAAAAAAVPSAKVPPVTPANEELPVDFGDDAQSIISSAISEQSFAMSECVTKLERKVAKKHIIEKNQENKPPSMMQLGATSTTTEPNGKQIMENGRVLTPLKREPLEYVSVNVGIKKKNRRKNRNFSTERAESPAALPSPPRFFVASGKKRKDMRPFVPSPMASTPEPQTRTARLTGGSRCEWTGNSMIIYNRGMQTPPHLRGRELDLNASLEYRPSLVSQELHKLKKLDLSYAEVLRKADACKHHHQQQHQQHRRRQNHQNYHQQH